MYSKEVTSKYIVKSLREKEMKLKENIAEHLCIPLDSIRIVWEDNSDVAENTLVGNFRERW
ncbi:MAG: hypothetical protein MJ160_01085 [Treponema sp.]|nr:hypothetical protein [Treponema sp.]